MATIKIISISINEAFETLNKLKKNTKAPKSAIIRQMIYYMNEHPDLLNEVLKENYDTDNGNEQ